MAQKLKPLVSIIILNYNAGDLLLNCVDSVLKTDYDNYEIIIVDNLSTDGSHRKCKEKFEMVQLIENSKNYGYCEGNNIGIRRSKGSFIVILNPDTEVEPDWLKKLLEAYRVHGDGLYQPKILSLYEKDVLLSTGNMIHIFGFGFARDKGRKDGKKQEVVEKINYASGTCLFTSKEVFEKVGLFDPFIFLYHDDLELGWRAAQLGIRSFYVPSSIIHHVESYSLKFSSTKFYWLERNRRYCLLTHYSKNTLKKMSFSLFLVEVMVWFFYLIRGFLPAKIKADINILKNKEYIEKRYLELESKKVIPDNELIKFFADNIFLPENIMSSNISKRFNSFLEKLSKKTKKAIVSRY